ncbi:DMT family transporter [Methyloferula stellata]|uniref:DMT family transporter n=1 Tax=Methyloferula stellata TaxID=876270 RepID=UPI00037F2354|nr:DMT family transporter [Methyloferula stellata]
MNPLIAALVLFAALLHAAWNAMLRGGSNRLWSMTVISIGLGGTSLLALPFLPSPAAASWPYLIASGLIHIGYNLSLVRQYRTGDLGEAYPIARGASPLLIMLGAAAFAGEELTGFSLIAIMLISLGIIGMAFHGQRMKRENLTAALTTGVFIALYSVIDGMGVRMAGDPFAYIAWMSSFFLLMPVYFVAMRGGGALVAPLKAWAVALTGGVVALVAYGIVIYAMQHSPMGIVSALRETSVVFATLLGWFFLGEPLSWRRLAACLVITTGTAGLGFSRETGRNTVSRTSPYAASALIVSREKAKVFRAF